MEEAMKNQEYFFDHTKLREARRKLNKLKAGDVISIYTTYATSARRDCRYYDKELYRLLITKMTREKVETFVLYGGEGQFNKAGDRYAFKRDVLVGTKWRMV
tara:strand:- start:1151 stop:1456 length:306 start_codon:yes stop_codon:yes gene_type:complete